MHTDKPTQELPASLAREAFALLCEMLPPPVAGTASVQAAREEGAMTALLALHPADAFQARLAARIVAMDAHSADGLRLAGRALDDPMEQRRCRALAASMARQSDAALRSLLRIQATSEKAEAAMQPAAMERAGYWWRATSVPSPTPPHMPASASPPADPPSTQPSAEAPPGDVQFAVAEPAPAQPDIDLAEEAKLYAAMYPDRVARIRAAGGLPAHLDFGPPAPDIVATLLRGQRRASTPQTA